MLYKEKTKLIKLKNFNKDFKNLLKEHTLNYIKEIYNLSTIHETIIFILEYNNQIDNINRLNLKSLIPSRIKQIIKNEFKELKLIK